MGGNMSPALEVWVPSISRAGYAKSGVARPGVLASLLK